MSATRYRDLDHFAADGRTPLHGIMTVVFPAPRQQLRQTGSSYGTNNESAILGSQADRGSIARPEFFGEKFW